MYVLGINCYSHDAACTLLRDGHIVANIEEERLNRERHSWKFPKNAINRCLEMEGISIDDVHHVTFFCKPWLEITGNLRHFLQFFPKTLNLLRTPSGGGELGLVSKLSVHNRLGLKIQREFGARTRPKIKFIEHHFCHAASSFFVSEFKEAAILTLDGRGESTTTLLARGHSQKIEKLKEIRVPHSLGHLYSAITDYLGFNAFFDEWKVMGLSAYGTSALVDEFKSIVHLLDEGGFELDLNCFAFHTHGSSKWLSNHFLKKFGPKRTKDAPFEQRHLDIAYALQRTLESAGVHLARHLHAITGLDALCIAGGVALNVLMNQRIIEETPFSKFFIQPIATDAGASLGAALFHYHQNLKFPRTLTFQSPYLGPDFSNEEIEATLKSRKVTYRRANNIAHEAATLVAQGKVLGWFQGRMESGPRALGNRSIVADPRDPKMKDKINSLIKKREFFRPFAPSVLKERVLDYFEMPKNQPSPFMILAARVLENRKSEIPAVTHVDGTARVHTVDQSSNPKYWQLIKEFEKQTGVPVVLNTSFNENEPIVCSPDDALNCFFRTEFDALAMGDFLILR